ncbi:acyl-CoA synthase [Oceaniovalibus guishaninsula JLT2003]|uniref:Acyl-CoA synthase n=1 Tax=Oceaniovalibus guishaninsula JLT2003 TaxID=1231392 RepID=K2H9F2_9RHOB|nr:AMP-binding protein [Oceaniovalibus guishaninsula]EKE43237.1 acyl-CoA synthase [Oceaniovalibus guishaninsula JLT2003]
MIRLGDLISRAARHTGSLPSVTCGTRSLTWRQLETRIWRMARALSDLGVATGDRVAYLGVNSHRYFEMYYTPSRIGALAVPLNFRLADAELVQMLGDCTPVVLMADAGHFDRARALQRAVPSIRHLVWADDAPAPQGVPAYDDLVAGDGDDDGADIDARGSRDSDPAILFYTGGTTGRGKGVMLSHANLFVNSSGAVPVYGFRQRETQLLSGPMFHLGSGSRVFSAALLCTHTVIVPRFDAAEAMRAIETHRIATVQLVPTMLAMILDHPDFARFDLSSLRLITYGAAVMPVELLRRALTALPGVNFVQAYGMTETSPVVTVLTSDHHAPDSGKLDTVGLPMPHADLRIVDEDDRDLPTGATGQILTRGPHVMCGYWNQPEATAKALRGGWYHTGDAGWLDTDGFLHIAGRTAEMIVSGGENIYPVEIEHALLAHPGVADAAVIGVADPHWGARVHAVVSPAPGCRVTLDDLAAHCRTVIAGYKCPRGLTVWDGPLPLTNIGKLDKAAIRAAVLAAT